MVSLNHREHVYAYRWDLPEQTACTYLPWWLLIIRNFRDDSINGYHRLRTPAPAVLVRGIASQSVLRNTAPLLTTLVVLVWKAMGPTMRRPPA